MKIIAAAFIVFGAVGSIPANATQVEVSETSIVVPSTSSHGSAGLVS